MKIISIILVILSILNSVRNDLPIHCLKEQIEGKWEFELEEKIHNLNPLENNCGHSYPDNEKTSYLAKMDSFKPFEKMILILNEDGSVTSDSTNSVRRMMRFKQIQKQWNDKEFIEMQKQQHAQGKQQSSKQDINEFMKLVSSLQHDNRFYSDLWTMIYDEGFEINYKQQRILLYSKYFPDLKNNSNYVSNCSSTLVGWYHNYHTNQFTCIRGTLLSRLNNNNKYKQINRFLSSESSSSLYQFLPLDFKDHQLLADKINSMNLSWHAGVSEDFKDMTISELNKIAGIKRSLKQFQKYSFKSKGGYLSIEEEEVSDLPSQFSWEDAMGKVKNQGKCGSCYIFATLEMIHLRLNILYGIDTELSYQHAMDCMYQNQGCEGGFPTLVAKFGNEVHFIEGTCKKYTAKKGKCEEICDVNTLKQVYKIGEYGYINTVYGRVSQRQIMSEIIKNGPIVLSLDVDYPFMIYKSGIFTKTPPDWILKSEKRPQWTKLAHSVVCFGWGYDQESAKKYWLVRNSWGEKWGEKGHMRIERGNDVLGVESSPEYAIPIVLDLSANPQYKQHILNFYNPKSQ